MNEYLPVNVKKFLKYTANSRREPFLYEWYTQFEKTINITRTDVILKPNGLIDVEASRNNPDLHK